MHWENAKALFLAAIELSTTERRRFLAERCNGDDELFDEVESLLASHFESEFFIEQPVFSIGSIMANGSPLAGKQFGSYRIEREIGHGGMGAVFLAERTDGEFKQRVALKLMRPGIATAEARRRFLYERQILADLEHPYIARLIDGGTTDEGIPFFVMEYVDGTPITQFAAALPLRERLVLFQRVCDAVAYAHRNLVIHRDLKPSNILVTIDGSPKLLDFGIAKLLDTRDNLTMTNVSAFTPDYASPEQLDGRSVTTASDVYSLGVLLYELLTGTSPYRFSTRSAEEVLRLIRYEPVVRPSDVKIPDGPIDRRSLTGDLEKIILHALRKEPERRYNSVEQFSADVERYLGDLPVVACQDTLRYRASRFLKRHRLGVAAAVLIVTTLILGIVATAWQASAARQERDVAQAEREKAERINSFLQQMLSYSNQSWTASVSSGKGRDVTINEMLDDISPKLDAELADQPELRARIFYTIGTAYNSQGRVAAAEKYLREALEIDRNLNGDADPGTMDIRSALGEIFFQTERYEEGIALYTQLIEAIRPRVDTLEKGRYRLAAAIHGLGSMHAIKGDMDAAIPALREARAAADDAALTGNERGLMAEIELNLGAALLGKNELTESEQLLRESLAIFRSLPGEPRWEMGVTLTRLGDCLARKAQYDEAEALLVQGEKIYRNAFGDSNHYIARNLNIRALAALDRGDLQTAKTLSRRSLAVLDSLPTPQKLVRARALFTLGTALCNEHHQVGGSEALRKSLELYGENGVPETAEVSAAAKRCAAQTRPGV